MSVSDCDSLDGTITLDSNKDENSLSNLRQSIRKYGDNSYYYAHGVSRAPPSDAKVVRLSF